jgi:hypothetical protein
MTRGAREARRRRLGSCGDLSNNSSTLAVVRTVHAVLTCPEQGFMSVVMRRLPLVVALVALLLITSDTWSANTVNVRMGSIGYVDYRNKPRFKVGDWVKYHFSSSTDDGQHEDYVMTILISGREKFWGDDCFWVETWTGGRTLTPQVTSVLMSYSAFGDTSWLQHLQVYQRKFATHDENGLGLAQELVRRALGGKAAGDDRPSLTVLTDTLGRDTVHVALGVFDCTKVRRKAGTGMSEERGDSTYRTENWDQRHLYLSPRVPITSLVRERDERWITRKAWKAGQSNEAVTHYVLRGTGTFDLVEWGSGDLAPKMTPEYAQGGAFKNAKPLPTRPGARKGS